MKRNNVAAQAPQCHAMNDAADMQMAHQPMTMSMDDGGAIQHGHDCSNHGACTVGATLAESLPVEKRHSSGFSVGQTFSSNLP